MSTDTPTRGPATIGYLPWVLHRVSALALVALLAAHVGVQLYPEYGFVVLVEWGIYRPILDLTLGLVLLHAFLGVRSTVIETRLSPRRTSLVVWLFGAAFFLLFAVRLLV
ncbi:hypothetical protein [Natrialbaceae archaeon AArc-T1-2]|uniref:hypothetical protein n=1 Tax=Natrialbaceae archaeon AArc-T1-2 TaxID=3053904 RepID=UPI00255ABA3E|nr:hypothetical protein [Natrialbaceae archaeon AArc-T1-2]WIV67026.1 hypothetical protein QQ977_15275 [Natrialbaceae archaeon AArc-T1-2]